MAATLESKFPRTPSCTRVYLGPTGATGAPGLAEPTVIPIGAMPSVQREEVVTWTLASGEVRTYKSLLEKQRAHMAEILRIHNIRDVDKITDILSHDISAIAAHQTMVYYVATDGTKYTTEGEAASRSALVASFIAAGLTPR